MISATTRLSTLLQRSDGDCESVQSIINIAATAEAFAVTALGGALDSAAKGMLDLSDEAIQSLTAARATEQIHYKYLTNAGAKALTLDFTIPAADSTPQDGTPASTPAG